MTDSQKVTDQEIQEEKNLLAYFQETAQNFLDRETLGGFILLLASILALILANSGLSHEYHAVLKKDFVIGISGEHTLKLSLEKWINDGLMVIFFLVAGMEMKREIILGELSSYQKASMPLLAALGGMVLPASIFIAFNFGSEGIKGWGIPMATDIAYSLGIVALLGKRVPIQLKVFLTALAIADDMGAILVIAFFYSSQIATMKLLTAGVILIILVILNRLGVKHLLWYLLLGVGLWMSFLHSGVHPTIAGVLFAFTVPIKPRIGQNKFRKRTARNIEKLEADEFESYNPLSNKEQRNILETIHKVAKHHHPPMLRLENALTGFNAFFVLPLFAMANAGVRLNIGVGEVLADDLGLGILLGLLVGKVSGISLFSYLGYKFGIASLPENINWRHIIGLGFIAGIGFTMSLFISYLAFDQENLIKLSKISILLASFSSGVIGLIILGVKRQKSMD